MNFLLIRLWSCFICITLLGRKEEQTVEALLTHIGYHTLTIELFAKTCEISPSTTPQKIYQLLEGKTPFRTK